MADKKTNEEDGWMDSFQFAASMQADRGDARQAIDEAHKSGDWSFSALQKYISGLPYELSGGLAAKGMSVNMKNMVDMLNSLFDAPFIVECMLRPYEDGVRRTYDITENDKNTRKSSDPNNDSELSLVLDFSESTDPRQAKLLAYLRENEQRMESLRAAMAVSFRANRPDVRSDPDDHVVKLKMQKKLAHIIGGLIEISYRGALTDPKHDIWGRDVAGEIVNGVRDHVVRKTQKLLPFLGLVTDVDYDGPN